MFKKRPHLRVYLHPSKVLSFSRALPIKTNCVGLFLTHHSNSNHFIFNLELFYFIISFRYFLALLANKHFECENNN